MKQTILPVLSLCIAFALNSARGGEREGGFRADDVPAAAKWFVHVDLATLRESEIGKDLVSRIDGDAQRKIRAFKRMISFNPLEDLDAVTLSGSAAGPDKAVALLRGVFDVEHLTDLAMGANGYEGRTHRGKTIHSWLDEKTPGKRLFGCLLSGNAMLMGPDRGLVVAGIDRAAGEGKPIAGGAAFIMAADEMRSPVVTAGVDLASLGDLKIESNFVKRARSVYLAAGEADGKVFARLLVATKDERAPVLLGKMLGGMLAFGEAAEKLPEGTEAAVEVVAEGEKLDVDASMPLDVFLELVKGLKGIENLKGKL